MKITVPKDSAAEARIYLQAWMDLHEGNGMNRAKRMISLFRLLSFIAIVSLLAGIVFGWHPVAIGLAGIVLGYTGAEAGALMSRMRVWPHNEKYLDWKAVKEALHAPKN